ncbi:hypothetical protein LHJ74_29815 [Streptomyces sp. N2-109]|uniref:Uncharacterized protein n=1 Tax=Streptomyces gossypii TaxID=2883101 RepID=A0ABT2K3E8_9ACTN|nr:hypothetical protein [Streptomyces gossypii]MCT2594055.1 hypothetical protein [Streptomyces gossypii]
MATVSPQNPGSAPDGDDCDGLTALPSAFAEELCALALDIAPRLFAVAQVHAPGTDEADGRVAAWGMAYEDGRAQVVSVDGGARMSVGSAESALRWFARREGITARLVWLSPPAAASLQRDADG